MKKIILPVLLVLILLVPVSAVSAHTLFQGMTAPVDMEEPIRVEQITGPSVPNPLLPGTTLSWDFQIENTSSRDYWVQGYVAVATAAGGISYDQGLKRDGVAFTPYQPFLVPAKAIYRITVSIYVREDSPIAQGVQFSPVINRAMPPSTEEKG